MQFDSDFLIIGSGFGGSVSALRLSEKGYRVTVLEQGRRWTAESLPKTNWNVPNFLWAPLLRCFGIFKMTLLRHVFVLSGAGVGGGSLVYANTLLIPKEDAWKDPSWRDLADWKDVLAPHYQTARQMLGVALNPGLFAADEAVRQYAREIGQEQSFSPTEVAIFFGEPGKTVPDPYFGGEGPPRAGCTFCGGCMVGCRQNAKNTLDKNYLYLAERRGAQIRPERRVTRVEPIEGGGYRVYSESSTGWWRYRRREIHTTRQLVLSAGVLGTVDLLLHCKDQGWLPKLSPKLGQRVRTNSEAILGVTQRTAKEDFSKGIAIGSRMDLDEHTHMEPVRYPPGASALALITTPLTDGGGSVPRWLRWIWAHLLSPWAALAALWPRGWSQRTIILLVMQTLENELQLSRRRRWYWPFASLSTDLPAGQTPAPTWLPAANRAARDLSARYRADPRSSLPEALLDVPTTAHILGGCAMGKDAESGVIDHQCRVFGYEGMYVIDGSMIGANLGVNPSLTITALAEYAMSHIPEKENGAHNAR